MIYYYYYLVLKNWAKNERNCAEHSHFYCFIRHFHTFYFKKYFYSHGVVIRREFVFEKNDSFWNFIFQKTNCDVLLNLWRNLILKSKDLWNMLFNFNQHDFTKRFDWFRLKEKYEKPQRTTRRLILCFLVLRKSGFGHVRGILRTLHESGDFLMIFY